MNEKEKVLTHLDIPYSYELAKRMEAYRCNPELGYRSAGSKAEFLTVRSGWELTRQTA